MRKCQKNVKKHLKYLLVRGCGGDFWPASELVLRKIADPLTADPVGARTDWLDVVSCRTISQKTCTRVQKTCESSQKTCTRLQNSFSENLQHKFSFDNKSSNNKGCRTISQKTCSTSFLSITKVPITKVAEPFLRKPTAQVFFLITKSCQQLICCS